VSPQVELVLYQGMASAGFSLGSRRAAANACPEAEQVSTMPSYCMSHISKQPYFCRQPASVPWLSSFHPKLGIPTSLPSLAGLIQFAEDRVRRNRERLPSAGLIELAPTPFSPHLVECARPIKHLRHAGIVSK
jgi:hypothetical protein